MFIRTKDGIYEIESEFLDNEGKWVGYNIVGNDMVVVLRIQVINQADTIKELCDEFRELLPKYKGNDIIGYEPEKWEYAVSDKKFYNDIGEWCYVEDFIIRGYTVYGAIWTDKGLIYVAKMNAEGKFILL